MNWEKIMLYLVGISIIIALLSMLITIPITYENNMRNQSLMCTAVSCHWNSTSEVCQENDLNNNPCKTNTDFNYAASLYSIGIMIILFFVLLKIIKTKKQ